MPTERIGIAHGEKMGGVIPERWATSNWNAGRDQLGIRITFEKMSCR
jgi:hypothetical protein